MYSIHGASYFTPKFFCNATFLKTRNKINGVKYTTQTLYAHYVGWQKQNAVITFCNIWAIQYYTGQS